ncbi:MAG: energy-coupling factor transporter transmembrane protein EcfT [Erysipelotrichaceae bacterium]|jgi:energy-coupling factor transport system permease protein|nr:energy-coupling factor transporter transmembrane protein EcfT [Erysipelotrichaceae bacterium]
MKIKTFSYSQLDTFVHRLSGLSKLVCFLLLTSAIMLTYDIRIILAIMVLSFVMMQVAKIRYSQIRLMLIYVMAFLVVNFFLTYLFEPEYGVAIYGTKHVLFSFGGHYTVTQEQLFYQFTKLFKYLSVIPLGIIFVLTTNPSEFASSLNGVGVSYKICTALSLTLRYFPDVADDYNTIALAQQARGVEMSSKAKMMDRLKRSASILIPLIMTTMDRIELISNAMDLRGYGKHRKRTWYARKPLRTADYISMAVCLAVLVFTLYVRFFINHSIYYNPFI